MLSSNLTKCEKIDGSARQLMEEYSMWDQIMKNTCGGGRKDGGQLMWFLSSKTNPSGTTSAFM